MSYESELNRIEQRFVDAVGRSDVDLTTASSSITTAVPFRLRGRTAVLLVPPECTETRFEV